MARIPYFDPTDAPDDILRAMGGKRKINVFRMIANAENCAPETLALGHRLSRGSSLAVAHREVVILRVAHLTPSPYQWREHTRVATREGFTPEKVQSVAAHPEASDHLDAHERLLLDFTDQVVGSATVDDETFAAVRALLDDSRLVELVLLIGFYMMVGRVMNVFELELEDAPVGTYQLRLD